ncbi:MAG: hypothetical protein KF814_05055 [Nitrospiraceae bacterium]|nr:hypothetical protein [Nitrospiraceae bacterium]
MAEVSESHQAEHRAPVVSVQLKSSSNHASPVLANLTSVSIAQGLAHVEFAFVEPSVLATIAQGRDKGVRPPKEVPGVLATRLVLPIEAALHLQQQLTQLLRQLSAKSQPDCNQLHTR